MTQLKGNLTKGVVVINICSKNDPFNYPRGIIITSQMAISGSVFITLLVIKMTLTDVLSQKTISIC